MSHPVFWAPEHDAMLRDNFDKGLPLSYLQMAHAINGKFGTEYSRNATIGRGHRLGLKVIGRIKRSPEKPKRKPKTTPAQRPDVAIRKAAAGPKLPTTPAELRQDDVIAPRRVSLLELTEDTCRWPISTVGEPDFCFCGNPPVEGKPYCAGHFMLGFKPSKPSTTPSFRLRGRA